MTPSRPGTHHRVSVVVPAWRPGPELVEAVASAAHQPYVCEVVVVDDSGRPEEMARVRAMLTGPWPVPVVVCRTPANRGPGEARRVGAAVASGAWVAFLDADDLWLPGKMQAQVDVLSRNPDVQLVGARAGRPGGSASVPDRVAAREVSFHRLLFSNPVHTSSAVVRRDLAVGFPTGRAAEDFEAWLLAARTGRVLLVDHPLSVRRKAAYGDGGLSGHLWRMQRGEHRVLARSAGWSGGGAVAVAAISWSWVKWTRRVAVVALRRVGARRWP